MVVGSSNLRDVEEGTIRCGEWQYIEIKWWKITTKFKKWRNKMLAKKTL